MKKKTTPAIATLASKVLRSKKAGRDAKRLAGSALSQVNSKKNTGS
jgi:hypothetical protein